MNIHEFLSSPGRDRASATGPHDRIVMSSRVRLARNFKGVAFPGWAKKAGARPVAGDDPAGGRGGARR